MRWPSDSAGGVTDSAARPVNGQGLHQLPNVSLSRPVANQGFTAPANISLVAMASDAAGNIARVKLFQGSTLVGSATVSPDDVAWNDVPTGRSILTAKATADLRATRSSAVVPITATGGGRTILYLHGDHLGTRRVATNKANIVVYLASGFRASFQCAAEVSLGINLAIFLAIVAWILGTGYRLNRWPRKNWTNVQYRAILRPAVAACDRFIPTKECARMNAIHTWFEQVAGVTSGERARGVLAQQVQAARGLDVAALQKPACWRRKASVCSAQGQ
jgi:hypothetical protein